MAGRQAKHPLGRDYAIANSTPSPSTAKRLFALSKNRCAFSGCDTALVDRVTGSVVGQICHIHAQCAGGPRFLERQTDEERRAFDNLILMCGVHHTVIDDPKNLDTYTADYLRELKAARERDAGDSSCGALELSEEMLQRLLRTAVTYEPGAVHVDLRNTFFQIGGMGGGFGGGGGGGGILTVVGTTRIPDGSEASLDGEDGRAPGAGGGGAGGVRFIGRPLETYDLDDGFRVTGVFPCNAVHESANGLCDAKGIGWTHLNVPSTPSYIAINVAVIVELGSLVPETLIRLQIGIVDCNGQTQCEVPLEIASTFTDDLVPCAVRVARLEFKLQSLGVYSIQVMSAGRQLASCKLELRQGA